MKERIVRFCKEVWLQAKILFQDGRAELKLYRLERDLCKTVLWVPSKGNWVRARLLFHGQKYDRIQFVDGKGGKGKRSPLSYRSRDPRKRGADKPDVDARYSGNRPSARTMWARFSDASNRAAISLDKLAAAFYDSHLGIPYKPEGG